MSTKVYDRKNRHRNKTVSFHMSPEENELLNNFVKISGLTKQDYLIHRVLQKDIIINGNPRVFKGLKNQLNEIVYELKRIETFDNKNNDLLDVISFATIVLEGLINENEQ